MKREDKKEKKNAKSTNNNRKEYQSRLHCRFFPSPSLRSVFLFTPPPSSFLFLSPFFPLRHTISCRVVRLRCNRSSSSPFCVAILCSTTTTTTVQSHANDQKTGVLLFCLFGPFGFQPFLLLLLSCV